MLGRLISCKMYIIRLVGGILGKEMIKYCKFNEVFNLCEENIDS